MEWVLENLQQWSVLGGRTCASMLFVQQNNWGVSKRNLLVFCCCFVVVVVVVTTFSFIV